MASIYIVNSKNVVIIGKANHIRLQCSKNCFFFFNFQSLSFHHLYYWFNHSKIYMYVYYLLFSMQLHR